jgi:hypothetical protein
MYALLYMISLGILDLTSASDKIPSSTLKDSNHFLLPVHSCALYSSCRQSSTLIVDHHVRLFPHDLLTIHCIASSSSTLFLHFQSHLTDVSLSGPFFTATLKLCPIIVSPREQSADSSPIPHNSTTTTLHPEYASLTRHSSGTTC